MKQVQEVKSELMNLMDERVRLIAEVANDYDTWKSEDLTIPFVNKINEIYSATEDLSFFAQSYSTLQGYLNYLVQRQPMFYKIRAEGAAKDIKRTLEEYLSNNTNEKQEGG